MVLVNEKSISFYIFYYIIKYEIVWNKLFLILIKDGIFVNNKWIEVFMKNIEF